MSFRELGQTLLALAIVGIVGYTLSYVREKMSVLLIGPHQSAYDTFNKPLSRNEREQVERAIHAFDKGIGFQ
jgi:hypothetical protein